MALEPVYLSTRPIDPIPDRITIVMPYRPYPGSRIGYRYRAPGSISRHGGTVIVKAAAFPLIAGIIMARGQLVTYQHLMEALWGDREDGGPSGQAHDVYMCHYRRHLRDELGIRIDTRWGMGWSAHDVNDPQAWPTAGKVPFKENA